MTTTANPLLETGIFPAFDRIEAQHVVDGMAVVLREQEAQLTEIEALSDISWSNFVPKLDAIERTLNHSWGAVAHLLSVQNSEELRTAYESVQAQIVTFSMRIAQSSQIYASFCSLRDGSEWKGYAPAQQRIITNAIRDAELSGIALEGADKERFNVIQTELAELQTTFSNNVMDATKAFVLDVENKADVDGLPDSSLELAAQAAVAAGNESATAESGPWRFTLDYPSFVPFMENAKNAALRQQMYMAFISKASAGEHDNQPIIQKILQLRREHATLLGYDNFAALSLASKMADSPQAVYDLLEQLHTVSKPFAEKEHQELCAFAEKSTIEKNSAEKDSAQEKLRHWDIAYWAKRLQEARYQYNDEDLRPYFSLPKVLEGLFALATRLFAVRIEAADGEAPIWDDAVRYFKIFRIADADDADSAAKSSEQQCASFYLDPYSRPENKRGGAWMNDCVSRHVQADGSIILPVAHLVCNSTPPVGDKPSLMTFREVETLFHEFGHGLQHMLTTVDHTMAAGISNVEWDAVELPSQFMENWCYDKTCVDDFARHYESGECIPEELFNKICAARCYRAGSMMQRQLGLSETDMKLYDSFDASADNADAFAVQAEIGSKHSVLTPLAEDKFLCGFSHIFAGGYAAGYFSYKWAEVLSADAFAAFEEAGLDNDQAITEVGHRFRDTILAQGGSRPAMDIYKSFRGREPSTEALLRHNGLS